MAIHKVSPRFDPVPQSASASRIVVKATRRRVS
jgi:hypothetical protein